MFKKSGDMGQGASVAGGESEEGKEPGGSQHQEKKVKSEGMSFTTKKKAGGEGAGKKEDTRSKALNAKNTKLLSFEDD